MVNLGSNVVQRFLNSELSVIEAGNPVNMKNFVRARYLFTASPEVGAHFVGSLNRSDVSG